MRVFRNGIDPNEVGYGAPASSATILIYNVVCAPTFESEEGSEISNIAYSYVTYSVFRLVYFEVILL